MFPSYYTPPLRREASAVAMNGCLHVASNNCLRIAANAANSRMHVAAKTAHKQKGHNLPVRKTNVFLTFRAPEIMAYLLG